MHNSSVLEKLIENNEYPIVFIGSGISRRYLDGFLGWEELLKFFWEQVSDGKDFYSFLNTLRAALKEQNNNITDSDLDYLTNVYAGTEIEVLYNNKFYKQEIEIPNFSQEQAYKTKISPFKKAISNKLAKYSIRHDMKIEYEQFKEFLNKTQVILTTNYDTLLEDCYNSINNGGAKKYIGQKGFFEQTDGWAEIYKLHGCVQDPSSITITKTDYDVFEQNSILISARIISLLINSPIIFFGYSLTDRNIRKIIRDFSSSLTYKDIQNVGSKIIIVERVEGLNEISEHTFYDKELNCEYTILKTDNFGEIYSNIMKIDQGLAPSEVRRYQNIIKRLIVNSGKKGSLKSLLIAPEQLEDIERRLGDEKLIVALGDATYIFKMPDLISYVYDYFFDRGEIHTDIALRFVASQTLRSRTPFLKHLKNVNLDDTNLNHKEKEKIRQRILGCKDVHAIITSVNPSYTIKMNSLRAIIAEKFKQDKEFEIVSYNATRIDLRELEEYAKQKILDFQGKGVHTLSSQFRRLLVIIDILKHGEQNKVTGA